MPESTQAPRRRVHLVRGVVPSSAVVVALVLATLLAWPAGRQQVSESFTRQPASFLALSFADPGLARSCPDDGGRLRLDAALDNRGDRSLDLTSVVVVSPSGGRPARTERTRVRARAAAVTPLPIDVQVPRRRAYTVEVGLLERTEKVRVHCGSGA